MVGVSKPKTQVFVGAAFLRQRLVLSTLSGTPIRITKIHEDDDTSPGLSPSEISFIRLLDKITSGAVIQINDTGTVLSFRPGLLIGGDRLQHDCHPTRATAYYAEPLLMLAPFCKHPISITLRGPTHAQTDVGADAVAGVTVPLLRRLFVGVGLKAEVRVVRRAVLSDGKVNGGGCGGEVVVRCEVAMRKVPAIDLVRAGVIKRVRGLAVGNRVAPSHISRMVDTTRGILNAFSPDVYVHTDHGNAPQCGVGFGVGLVAESTEGCVLGGDWVTASSGVSPEDVAKAACGLLLEEVEGGGCVDSNNVPLAVLICALAEGDVSRVRVGKLSEGAVCMLRDLERFFGVRFIMRVLGGSVGRGESDDDEDGSESESEKDEEVEKDEEKDEEKVTKGGVSKVIEGETRKGYGIILSCVGIGLSNLARQRF